MIDLTWSNNALALVPALSHVGVKTWFNGIEAFTEEQTNSALQRPVIDDDRAYCCEKTKIGNFLGISLFSSGN
ncbi:hypothetical protein NKJ10_25705 [Mesorhizobium sp. M0204]|uniref:hypothetical protein n=1 Tax=Mesorhizobium sp. M0204 TaxID=2956913 RepID=UPI00333BAB32